MGARTASGEPAGGARGIRAWVLILLALALLGVASSPSTSSPGGRPVAGIGAVLPAAQNDSSSPSPSAAGAALCPSSGPVILGIEWNCVAVLNLTELGLILASLGIVAYVFKDADRAELPGDCAEVPVTAEEWETYRRARSRGIRYEPPEPESGVERK